jgi:hypothetical protein
LEEEHQNYKRKLSNYQEGQQKQAQLVQKLQQKVVHFILFDRNEKTKTTFFLLQGITI